MFPTKKPNFIATEVNSRTVGRKGHDVVDQRRQKAENVVVVADVDVDRSDAVGKRFDFAKMLPARMFQDELKVAESLDEWNDLTRVRSDFGREALEERGPISNLHPVTNLIGQCISHCINQKW